MQSLMLGLGVLLILVTPLVAILPGPGGIFVFAAGLVLILKNSAWARKRFARFKRRWPRVGHYADRALRRQSARRRRERDAADAEANEAAPQILNQPDLGDGIDSVTIVTRPVARKARPKLRWRRRAN